ncbi:MAG: hypothetical protein HZC28_13975 [Spirochaetes bacterium]|nr:hypothetical protein [Spirochaetota bacterium]
MKTLVAHMGFSKQYPANTLHACRSVIANAQANVCGIEVDVQLSKDGRIVIWHDDNLKHIVGNPAVIRDTTYDELAAITKAHSHFHGESIGLLEDLLEMTAHKTALYIEIKGYPYDHENLCDRMAAMLKKYGSGDIIVHSFTADILRLMMKRVPASYVRYGFLFSNMQEYARGGDIVSAADYLHPHFGLLLHDDGTIARAGKPMNIWTVNTQDDVTKLMQTPLWNSVESIITDDSTLLIPGTNA